MKPNVIRLEYHCATGKEDKGEAPNGAAAVVTCSAAGIPIMVQIRNRWNAQVSDEILVRDLLALADDLRGRLADAAPRRSA